MKKLFLILVGISVLLISCSKSATSQIAHDQVTTKTLIQTKTGNVDYFVSIQDVKTLLSNHHNIKEITSYPSNQEPLVYLVNCDPGFFIISGDKRAFPIIASSEDGYLDTELIDASYVLDEFSSPIRAIRSVQSLTTEMEKNVDAWHKITRTKYESVAASNTTYYYLIESRDIIRYNENIGPLLQTNWGQSNHYSNDHYWNNYCPWSDSTCTGSKCPVGCVAVAGGQFAYYMKDRNGVAIRIPTSASCSGYAGNYTQSFSTSFSVSMIDEMPLNYTSTNSNEIEHARIFLAYIGKKIGMAYSATQSSSFTSRLPNLFSQWGINSGYREFSDSLARVQIRASTPVVTRGRDLSNGGHSWVIDGYKSSYYIRQNYMYVSSEELSEEQIAALTMADWNGGYEEYIIPGNNTYHMNWGWNGAYNGWYATDNWSVANYDFSTNKHMIQI